MDRLTDTMSTTVRIKRSSIGAQIGATFAPQMDEYVKHLTAETLASRQGLDLAAEKQRRLDAMARAERLAAEAAK